MKEKFSLKAQALINTEHPGIYNGTRGGKIPYNVFNGGFYLRKMSKPPGIFVHSITGACSKRNQIR